MKTNHKLIVLRGDDIQELLTAKEEYIIQEIKNAYLLHHMNETSLPFSQFLKFPGAPGNRIIALPAYLGGQYDVAGLKWIASFPKNIDKNIPRASAVLILNSAKDGIPKAILEGAIISRLRTAASAALAVEYLYKENNIFSIGIIGCGVINYEIIRFLNISHKELKKILLYDTDEKRAELFSKKCSELNPLFNIEVHNEISSVMSNTRLLSFATTASKPFVCNDTKIQSGSLFLNISLRDLSPDIILKAYNVVDDIEHVLREETSLHLAALSTKNRNFIHATIGSFIANDKKINDHHELTVFSPFGLGILDLVLGNLVYNLSIESGVGLTIDSFSCSDL
jgi:2,3-diaminopropionate biosynthesis protein SbnB